MAALVFMVIGGLLTGGALSTLRQPRQTRGTRVLAVSLFLLAGLCVANGVTRL